MLGGLVALCGVALSLIAVAMQPNMFVQPLSSLRHIGSLPKAKSRMLMIAGAMFAVGSVISFIEEQRAPSTATRAATGSVHSTHAHTEPGAAAR